MRLPSGQECAALLKKYGVPENVLRHSDAVRGVANFLAQRIAANGFRVDLECVEKAALLHDLAKVHCIKNNCRHAAEAERILSELEYPEFGKILRLHGLEEVLDFTDSTPLEAKVLWYADKRVNHDKVVPMKERYDYLKEKYGSTGKEKLKEIVSTEKAAFALEKALLKMGVLGEDFERAEGMKGYA